MRSLLHQNPREKEPPKRPFSRNDPQLRLDTWSPLGKVHLLRLSPKFPNSRSSAALSTSSRRSIVAGSAPKMTRGRRVSGYSPEQLLELDGDHVIYTLVGKESLVKDVGGREVLDPDVAYVGKTIRPASRLVSDHDSWAYRQASKCPAQKFLYTHLFPLDQYLSHCDSTHFRIVESDLPALKARIHILDCDVNRVRSDPTYDPNKSITLLYAVIPQKQLSDLVRSTVLLADLTEGRLALGPVHSTSPYRRAGSMPSPPLV